VRLSGLLEDVGRRCSRHEAADTVRWWSSRLRMRWLGREAVARQLGLDVLMRMRRRRRLVRYPSRNGDDGALAAPSVSTSAGGTWMRRAVGEARVAGPMRRVHQRLLDAASSASYRSRRRPFERAVFSPSVAGRHGRQVRLADLEDRLVRCLRSVWRRRVRSDLLRVRPGRAIGILVDRRKARGDRGRDRAATLLERVVL
jgi:hypothetical protein